MLCRMLGVITLSIFFCLSPAFQVKATIKAEYKPRLVTIDGALTEIVFALGAGDSVVAVDRTSVYPPQVLNLPSVGYLRTLSAEGILSLEADHILTTQDAGPPEVMKQVISAEVPISVINEPYSEVGLYRKVRKVATIIEREEQGEALIDALRQQFAALNMAKLVTPPRVLFVMSSSTRGLRVAGLETRADALIKLAGGENVISSFSSYKPLTMEAAIQLKPDVLLVLSHDRAAFDAAENPALSLTPAVQSGKVFVLHGDELTFGTRLPEAVAKVNGWLYE